MPTMKARKPHKKTKPYVIIVIAGNAEQFRNYVANSFDKRLPFQDTFIFARDRESLMGIEADEIIRVGTWYERKDIDDIEREARMRLR